MSRARNALDAMSRLEKSPPHAPRPPNAPIATVTIDGAQRPVLFACFVRDAFHFPDEYLLLIVEMTKWAEAPEHLLIPAWPHGAAIEYLQHELQLSPREIAVLIGAARSQEKQFNARAKSLRPPIPSTIPDVTDDEANPPPPPPPHTVSHPTPAAAALRTREALTAEAQRLEGRRQARNQEKP